MKTVHFLFALIIPFLFSCIQQEDTVTFYSEDSISKEMIISTMLDGELQSSVHSSVTLDLMDSDFFENYINQLVLLEITSIKVSIIDYDYGLVNTNLELGNYPLLENGMDEIGQNGGLLIIKDSTVLDHISNILTNKHEIPFVFSGDGVSPDTFTLSISITFQGVFVD